LEVNAAIQRARVTLHFEDEPIRACKYRSMSDLPDGHAGSGMPPPKSASGQRAVARSERSTSAFQQLADVELNGGYRSNRQLTDKPWSEMESALETDEKIRLSLSVAGPGQPFGKMESVGD